MQEKDEDLTELLEDYEETIKLLVTAKNYRRDLEKDHDTISSFIVTAKEYCGDLEKDHDNISRFIKVLECWAERLYSKQTTIQNLRLIEGAENYRRSLSKKLIDEESK